MRKKFIVFLLFLIFILNAGSALALWDIEISAPDSTHVGEEITITVTSDGSPMEGADVYVNVVDNIGKTDSNGEITHSFSIIGIYSIYAVKGLQTSDTITVTVEQPVLSISSVNPLAPEAGDEVTITVKANLLDSVQGATVYVDGSSIGTTSSSGQISYTFSEGGTYSITAEKSGYTSSAPYILTVIDIKPLLVITPNNLVSSAGEEVTFTVTANLASVNGATVSVDGVSIGSTDGSGEIDYTFDDGGTYSITAKKTGYTDSAPYLLTITDIEPLLIISINPLTPEAGDEVTITVKANLLDTVQGATVSVKEDILSGSYSNVGTTDGNGQVIYTFEEGGTYLIKAEKNGYTDAVVYSLTILDVEILNNVEIKGAIFPIPELLENELLNYDDLPFQLPHSSLVATEDGLYIVFSNEKLEGGLANVEGLNLLSITWEGLEIGIIQATTVNLDKEGTSATIAQIESNPEEYAYELVTLEGTVRQCPFMLDVTSFNMAITIGRIGKTPIYDMDFSNLIDKTYNFNQNFDSDVFNNLINIGSNSIAFFDFDNSALWCDSESTIDAIVMYPNLVRDFTNVISENQIGDVVIPTDESVVLYLIDSEIDGEDTTIDEINSNFASYSNKIVSFEGSYLGVGASIKKIISASSAQIGNILPVDLSLHGDYIWTSPPPTSLDDFKDKSLFVFGASSISQSSVISPEDGSLSVYRFTGKVISASDIDGSLEGVALIVYSRDKVRDLSIEEITDNIRNYVEGEITNMKYILQRQSPEKTEVSGVLTVDNSTISVNKNDIENIDLNVKTEVKGVSITTVKLDDKPADIEVDVGGEVYCYLEISLNNVSDEDIEGGTIEFKVEASWLANSNIDKNKVKLMKYVDGNWVELSTEFYKEASGYVYYKAETPGFSVFAITGEKTSSSDGGQDGTSSTPGFELLVLILAFVSIIIWKRNRG